MSSIFLDLSLILVVALFSSGAMAKSVGTQSEAQPWRLQEYLVSAEKSPAQLLAAAEKLFDRSAVEASRKNPALAHAWQDRLAMLSALSQIFDPSMEGASKPYFARASKILETAMLKDPALLVRDGAVESMRRINRMRPGYISRWQSSLEAAFLSEKNHAEGEGYFIRETILSAMREASIRPGSKVMNAARGDSNGRVRARLDEWNTSTF
ncbi:MAG TPA: hypothetical protein VM901_04190 [Bdellovibrionota bacterium]|jgi:hypothetical protein|nr:hypothetical protein [Bdellovibrionota bacterium]